MKEETSSNRTSLESKRIQWSYESSFREASNRTSLESKLLVTHATGSDLDALLIEPVWNRNFRTYANLERSESSNRTSLESKPYHKNLGVVSGGLLIEPVWNRNCQA